MRRRTTIWWLCLGAAWLASAAYMAPLRLRGWVPHDEGTFGESAIRVLAGELPHRDFDELYTGGLSYLHAAAFRTLGISLASLRDVLFASFLAWVWAVYAVASRFVSPLVAAAVTLLAVAWSVPNYAAPVPSWYNLFLATFGVVAILSHLETGSRSALALAGVCGGLSFLAKSPGLYYVAGAGLFLVFREQCLARSAPPDASGRAPLYRAFVTASLLLLILMLFALVRASGGAQALVQFVLPGSALAVVVLANEIRGVPGSDRGRFATLLGMVLPLGIGFAVPVVLFALPYTASGSLDALVRGLSDLPMKRLAFAKSDLPFLSAGWVLLPVVVVLAAAIRWRSLRWIAATAAAAGLGTVLVLSGTSREVYGLAWHSLDLLPPAIVLAGAVLVWRWPAGDARAQPMMLLLCVTALANLVRFPFSAPIYFCYVAPLVVLSVAAVLSTLADPPRVLLGLLLVFYAAFAAVRITPGFIYAMGSFAQPDPQTEALALPRAGGLRVSRREAAEYERVVRLVQQHAGGPFIFAGPDCPEVYFLSGLRNPERAMFEFYEDPAGRAERILDAIETHRVRVVASFLLPRFSARDRRLEAALAERFPNAERVDRFEVRWR